MNMYFCFTHLYMSRNYEVQHGTLYDECEICVMNVTN
jgi:hypothetical protein